MRKTLKLRCENVTTNIFRRNIFRIFNVWAATWQNQQNECAPSEDSDQPGHPPSLIGVFAVRSMVSLGPKVSSCGHRRLWLDWADAQADLSVHWAHSHIVGFVMSRLIFPWYWWRKTLMVLTLFRRGSAELRRKWSNAALWYEKMLKNGKNVTTKMRKFSRKMLKLSVFAVLSFLNGTVDEKC